MTQREITEDECNRAREALLGMARALVDVAAHGSPERIVHTATGLETAIRFATRVREAQEKQQVAEAHGELH